MNSLSNPIKIPIKYQNCYTNHHLYTEYHYKPPLNHYKLPLKSQMMKSSSVLLRRSCSFHPENLRPETPGVGAMGKTTRPGQRLQQNHGKSMGNSPFSMGKLWNIRFFHGKNMEHQIFSWETYGTSDFSMGKIWNIRFFHGKTMEHHHAEWIHPLSTGPWLQ